MKALWRHLFLHSQPTAAIHPLLRFSTQASKPAPKPPRNTAASEAVFDVAWGMMQAACLAHLVFSYFLSTSQMVGSSMWPTFLPDGDVVLVEKLSHKCGRIKPGDIVTFTSPQDPRQHICKRLVALEGMRVAVPLEDPVADGQEHNQDHKQQHHQQQHQVQQQQQQQQHHLQVQQQQQQHQLGRLREYTLLEVPRGHVWVLGDNTDISRDSRSYGPVPRALISGRVFLQVWPLWRMRWFPSSHPANEAKYAEDASVAACR